MAKKLLTIFLGLLTTSAVFVSSAASLTANQVNPSKLKEIVPVVIDTTPSMGVVVNQTALPVVETPAVEQVDLSVICQGTRAELAEARREHLRLVDEYIEAQNTYRAAETEEEANELFGEYISAGYAVSEAAAYMQHLQRQVNRWCQ